MYWKLIIGLTVIQMSIVLWVSQNYYKLSHITSCYLVSKLTYNTENSKGKDD